jgi:hypothetical protein
LKKSIFRENVLFWIKFVSSRDLVNKVSEKTNQLYCFEKKKLNQKNDSL